MTIVNATAGELAYDGLLAFGLSLALWFAYHLLCIVFPMRHIVTALVLHILFFAVAGLVCFCFIVGVTVSRQPRWFMVLGFAMGALAYYGWFARYVRYCAALLKRLLALAARPFVRLGALFGERVWKPVILGLQKRREMIYNSRRKAREARRKRREEDGEAKPSKPKKAPIQAYTET